ncbi:hypothetical protein GOEFS_081_00070 [Gordonia effusa NBRC 100432]|uniref:Lipoprotein n=1 Tax=Gordonia effusa NBRC 100432 TaxID=1077974 RepID=H0R2L7_9ACTN|nr:hypothetical protein [Gordonia effusa]GAB19318.1 hypothetical protein GOEFS_081_00070 [Gordonia effusa NBRC 100432]
MSSPHSGARTAVRGMCCALALTTALSACGSKDSEPAPALVSNTGPCATESTSGAKGVNLLPITPASVGVSNLGGQPRELLAASPNTTAAQQVTITTTSTEERASGRTEQTVTMPITARIGCDDPTNVEMTLGEVTSPDVVLADDLKAERNSLAGMSIGPGSAPISLRIAPPDAASSQARSAVEQALVQALQHSIRLAQVPVGVGAVWKSTRTITGAATTTQTIEATLRSRKDDVVVLDVTVDETPVNDVFAVPGTNQTLRIKRYTMTGKGTITMDLHRALPSSGSITMTGARELVGNGAPLLQGMGFTVTYRSP